MWNSNSSSDETPAAELSYENDMENLLENLVEISSQSGLSDCDMDNDSPDNTHSSLSDWNIHNDADVSTWKSYALTHMSDSTKSSDSFVSDTPSDILNDNTKATALYGNMIFSDNLVILSSKRQKNKHTTF
ncbi:hypothetical protein FSP39_001569 [Pinctada imbricata]|uniref:Uncharacterized protein n=1 Tax=Pinctada imbricata TaxID=66713 RepID=A0AA89BN85_PINIB|nr:hypothetical protein FSP39_001569 [Pinctada imbricata]